jgi:two-component system, NtrC family, response regulator AtoC
MADQGHLIPSQAALRAFVAVDPASRTLLEQIKRIALAESTVLVSGESGTGKDLVANLLHYLGNRPEQPIVKIDCAGLPHELVESELFGYERGAFTGASQTKRGRLELAESGTLVLDEVSALTPAIQAKLLRVIEDRTFHRLGGNKPISVSARMIALTNADLSAAVESRTFRDDLFYRLNVVPIHLLPLRQRWRDIAPLAIHFLEQIAVRDRRELRFEKDALQALERYRFPGNVRELRNLVERAVLATTGPSVTAAALPAPVNAGVTAGGQKLSLAELERNYIAEILDHTRGKKSKAAEILGISRKNLLEKRKRYKLDE